MADLKRRQWRMYWEKEIQNEVDYIISRAAREMEFTNFDNDVEVLRVLPDRRFFMKDILDRLSANPKLEQLGCYAESEFEYYISLKRK